MIAVNKTMVLITIISLLACCITIYPPFLKDDRQKQSSEPSTDNIIGTGQKIRPSVLERANNPYDIILLGSERVAARRFEVVPELKGIYIRDGTQILSMTDYRTLNKFSAGRAPCRFYAGVGYG